MNYLWYQNLAEDSPVLEAAMTDIDGKRHRNTLPIGRMDPAVWEEQKAFAAENLPAPYVDLVRKTANPFITTVTDIAAP